MKGATFTDEIKDCMDCKLAKAKPSFRGKQYRATKPFERVHSDLMDPIKPCSHKLLQTIFQGFRSLQLSTKTQVHLAFNGSFPRYQRNN